MRLFIAITLESAIKDRLCTMAKALAESSLSGSFTRRENMHLTLAFIGETTRLSAVKAAVDSVVAPPFSLIIGGLDGFAATMGTFGGQVFGRTRRCSMSTASCGLL